MHHMNQKFVLQKEKKKNHWIRNLNKSCISIQFEFLLRLKIRTTSNTCALPYDVHLFGILYKTFPMYVCLGFSKPNVY